ncbi:nuclear transport factor 2 family protein [Knoellia sp. LjRoot47]|uniref:nuclear transport factor 2 family protein n=1 Tax=Knoellia sp. LjRoot47 TaxID=3342330 RepID=UPI003ECE57BB
MDTNATDESTETDASAALLLTRFADAIDAQDWEALDTLLAPGFRARYAHTGETFDRAGFVAVNRDYPGNWRLEREQVVDAGDEAVLRATVSDATGTSDEVHVVATFAAASGGVLTSVTEVWAQVTAADPDRR